MGARKVIEIPSDILWDDYIKLCGDLEASDVHSAGWWKDEMLDIARNGERSWGDGLGLAENRRLQAKA